MINKLNKKLPLSEMPLKHSFSIINNNDDDQFNNNSNNQQQYIFVNQSDETLNQLEKRQSSSSSSSVSQSSSLSIQKETQKKKLNNNPFSKTSCTASTQFCKKIMCLKDGYNHPRDSLKQSIQIDESGNMVDTGDDEFSDKKSLKYQKQSFPLVFDKSSPFKKSPPRYQLQNYNNQRNSMTCQQLQKIQCYDDDQNDYDRNNSKKEGSQINNHNQQYQHRHQHQHQQAIETDQLCINMRDSYHDIEQQQVVNIMQNQVDILIYLEGLKRKIMEQQQEQEERMRIQMEYQRQIEYGNDEYGNVEYEYEQGYGNDNEYEQEDKKCQSIKWSSNDKKEYYKNQSSPTTTKSNFQALLPKPRPTPTKYPNSNFNFQSSSSQAEEEQEQSQEGKTTHISQLEPQLQSLNKSQNSIIYHLPHQPNPTMHESPSKPFHNKRIQLQSATKSPSIAFQQQSLQSAHESSSQNLQQQTTHKHQQSQNHKNKIIIHKATRKQNQYKTQQQQLQQQIIKPVSFSQSSSLTNQFVQQPQSSSTTTSSSLLLKQVNVIQHYNNDGVGVGGVNFIYPAQKDIIPQQRNNILKENVVVYDVDNKEFIEQKQQQQEVRQSPSVFQYRNDIKGQEQQDALVMIDDINCMKRFLNVIESKKQQQIFKIQKSKIKNIPYSSSSSATKHIKESITTRTKLQPDYYYTCQQQQQQQQYIQKTFNKRQNNVYDDDVKNEKHKKHNYNVTTNYDLINSQKKDINNRPLNNGNDDKGDDTLSMITANPNPNNVILYDNKDSQPLSQQNVFPFNSTNNYNVINPSYQSPRITFSFVTTQTPTQTPQNYNNNNHHLQLNQQKQYLSPSSASSAHHTQRANKLYIPSFSTSLYKTPTPRQLSSNINSRSRYKKIKLTMTDSNLRGITLYQKKEQKGEQKWEHKGEQKVIKRRNVSRVVDKKPFSQKQQNDELQKKLFCLSKSKEKKKPVLNVVTKSKCTPRKTAMSYDTMQQFNKLFVNEEQQQFNNHNHHNHHNHHHSNHLDSNFHVAPIMSHRSKQQMSSLSKRTNQIIQATQIKKQQQKQKNNYFCGGGGKFNKISFF